MTGFTDAEASFMLFIKKKQNNCKIGYQPHALFQIGQPEKDRALL